MTKLEVANALRERTGISQKQAIDAVELFLDSIKDALKTGEKVSLVGFGTFYIKSKGERNGRNPRTGEKIRIPAKSIVTFKPGKEFRDVVNDALETTGTGNGADHSAAGDAPPAGGNGDSGAA